MKLKRKNKKLKGMTLIECIIAMAVLAITGVILARVGAMTNRLQINANHLNNKTQAEAAIGSVKDKDTLDDYCQATDDAGNLITSNGEQSVTIQVGGYGSVTANRYSTKGADVVSDKDCDTNLDDDASLQFYILN